jgi:hypothetical protein
VHETRDAWTRWFPVALLTVCAVTVLAAVAIPDEPLLAVVFLAGGVGIGAAILVARGLRTRPPGSADRTRGDGRGAGSASDADAALDGAARVPVVATLIAVVWIVFVAAATEWDPVWGLFGFVIVLPWVVVDAWKRGRQLRRPEEERGAGTRGRTGRS